MKSEFRLHGDYMLGGLFEVHSSVNYVPHNRPVSLECSLLQFLPQGYQMLQVMRFAVEEINNSTSILPDVSLGYEIFDYCSAVENLPSAFDFLSRNGSIAIHDDFENFQPKVLSVFGPYGSTQTLTVAPLFMMDLLAMVNYGSSTSILSDKMAFPSFLRTVSSNRDQVELIIHILQKFSWTWVAFIGCDDEYSQDATSLFIDGIQNTNICMAYQEELSDDSNHSTTLHNINMLRVNVIILYTVQKYAISFIESAIINGIRDKVWIGSDAWSLNKELPSHEGIGTIGTIIGVTEKVVNIPGLADFVYKSLAHSKGQACEQGPLPEFGTTCNQDCHNCSCANPADVISEDPSYNFAIYSSVYIVANALHRVLQCDAKHCNKTEVFPYKLLEEIWKTNFTLLDQHIIFDKNGDSPARFNIVLWTLTSSPYIQNIGSYNTDPFESFNINSTLIHWYTNGTVPVSRCSEECEKGHIRRPYGIFKCCFQCEICPNGTYVNVTADPTNCIPCEEDEWADPGSTSCTKRSVEYLLLREPPSILLLMSVSFLLVLSIAIGVLFAFNYSTPVVKSAGGSMCFLMLGCLSGAGSSVFFYIGKPKLVTCLMRNPLFSLLYTVCLSCLTVRSFQIVCIFKMAAKLPRAYEWWVKYSGQWLFIGLASATQLVFCGLFYPKPYNDTVSINTQIIMTCSLGNMPAMGAGVFFIGFLCVSCFTFSYMGTDLPKNYNEARSITFCMLLFCTAWVSYFTLYFIYKGKYLLVFNALSMLTSSYSIVFTYFVPKSYIIVFQPEKNTQAHFQSSIQDYTQKISRM
ncbi:taste receptor type 1 member 1-like [Megalops cyprinoides]|uniref:taste receptor type 1 member 1-like n=1 Tax=Megalops cyprinoides TaxID=118141 RepID=UPI0018640553|nr:taste receptor type 1 member 1-like [Megalops cyprinoides]